MKTFVAAQSTTDGSGGWGISPNHAVNSQLALEGFSVMSRLVVTGPVLTNLATCLRSFRLCFGIEFGSTTATGYGDRCAHHKRGAERVSGDRFTRSESNIQFAG